MFVVVSHRHCPGFGICRMWLLSYLIFNACLYAGQLVLYTLLFLPKANREFLYGVIMLTLTIINFALPIILLVLFFYLSIMFAGFPFKSRMALVKLNKICKVRRKGLVVIEWDEKKSLLTLLACCLGWLAGGDLVDGGPTSVGCGGANEHPSRVADQPPA